MAGIFGNHPEDKARERELNAYLDKQQKEDNRIEEIAQLAKDNFFALPNFYRSRDGSVRWTNMEDAVDSIKQEEWIGIARALREGDMRIVGDLLRKAIDRVLIQQAENGIDERE